MNRELEEKRKEADRDRDVWKDRLREAVADLVKCEQFGPSSPRTPIMNQPVGLTWNRTPGLQDHANVRGGRSPNAQVEEEL